MLSTLEFSFRSAPFLTAVSAIAMQYSHGLIMPAVGAHSAAITSSEILGSRFLTSSPESISHPSTPFATELERSFSIVLQSSSLNASTYEPILLYGTSSFFEISSACFTPSTLSLAISVPGSGSYPAWMIAEFALVVPSAISFSASTMTISASYRDNL